MLDCIKFLIYVCVDLILLVWVSWWEIGCVRVGFGLG